MHKYYMDRSIGLNQDVAVCAECGDYWPCDDRLTLKERNYATWLVMTGHIHWALEYELGLLKKYMGNEYRDGLPLFEFENLGVCCARRSGGGSCDVQ